MGGCTPVRIFGATHVWGLVHVSRSNQWLADEGTSIGGSTDDKE